MALDNFGISFLPQGNSSETASGPGGARLEDVLRVLSFRLPRVLGSRPIAPAELLTSQGGAGDPLASAIAQQVLQSIAQGSPGGGGVIGGPAPVVGGGMRDMGAPSPLSQLFAPVFGPGRINTPADLPSPTTRKPRVIPVEDTPSGGRGALGEFGAFEQQLQGRRRPPRQA